MCPTDSDRVVALIHTFDCLIKLGTVIDNEFDFMNSCC